jgi:glycine betaine/proline transport system substrate-binding protein
MRPGITRFVLAATATVLVLIVAACGGNQREARAPVNAEGASSAAAEKGGDPSAIRIAVNPWTGSAVNANVAKILLERELGYKVQLVNIDEYRQFPALASGALDATLEVWPSGHAADIARYINGRRGGPLRDGGVVNGGRLGAVGDIGWWVPSYLVAQHPELATSQGIKGNEDLFRTAASGAQGQLLDANPSFVSYDKEIIKSLGLNLKVVYSGSEKATLSALDAAFRRKAPLLLYFWTPHWAHAKYDLTQVKLPVFDKACETAAREKDGAGYDCDYANDILFKAFSIRLEHKAPNAFRFLRNFRFTNDDQERVAYQVDARGVDVATAAQQWVDQNKSVWGAWLPQ